VCVVEIVRLQLPAGEVIEEDALIVCEDREVNVVVVSGLAAEPGVDRPAPAEHPRGGKRGHELRDEGDWFGYVVRLLA
jgi:hypothetical protein